MSRRRVRSAARAMAASRTMAAALGMAARASTAGTFRAQPSRATAPRARLRLRQVGPTRWPDRRIPAAVGPGTPRVATDRKAGRA
ncbi:MAG: hypothetical protein AVDCRST_MAG49-236 [uncultured Thermomicrobiales bacterium]|uniref:Secreted protein n=1 Tax=uncultured Thermomicrobiales bacterium TaxID=1645740 RepID=A0A6J4U1T5_9BACT|nr:MAG: hypothetical protein AVDCRST_MAG49-236 [uncultured Thermomicrobiales bacterium]